MAVMVQERIGAPRLARQAATACLAAGGILTGVLAGTLIVAAMATWFFGYQVLTVRSDSMAPAINAGDVIVVRPAAIRDIRPGDIVLFESGSDRIPTVHRVAGINEIELRLNDRTAGEETVLTEQRLVTRGDRNEMPDASEVTAENLLGEVWVTAPGAGGLTGLPVQYVLLAFAFAVVVLWGMWEWRRVRGGKQ